MLGFTVRGTIGAIAGTGVITGVGFVAGIGVTIGVWVITGVGDNVEGEGGIARAGPKHVYCL